MKRIICTLLCALVIITGLKFPYTEGSAAGISTMPTEQYVINTVGLLEIMNGDEQGNLNLDSYVTRAEFVKMALCTSTLKNQINSGSSFSQFTDVRSTHWAVGYVSAAVANGYVKGYLDGTFKPDNKVTLEEAVTVMLRLMGFTELDKGKYPDTQLAKYKELELDNRIYAARGQQLTRRECMYLMYNALCAKAQNGKIYCENLGYPTDENGRIDYLSLISLKMQGPIVVRDESYKNTLGFNLENAKVYRNNENSAASDIQLYDVIYHSKALNTVWVYSDKVTGMIEAISPNRISPSSVTVSGKNYALESTAAAFAVSNLGNIRIGDNVTLLLGKNAGVIEIIPAKESSKTVYGFITGFSEKEYERPNGTKYTAETVTVLGIDTQSYSYEYENSYFNKGDFVSASYQNGTLSISKVKNGVSSTLASTINSLVSTGAFSDSANIIDVYITSDNNSLEDSTVEYVKLYPSRLSGTKLMADEIYYAEISQGKIQNLVLRNYTGDIYTYGIVTSERKNSRNVYTMISGGKELSGAVDSNYGEPATGPSRFIGNSGKYIAVALSEITVDKNGFERGYCVSGGDVYDYASKVDFYIKNGARDYVLSTYDDIAKGDYVIKAYYDKEQSFGGRVRIIVAQ